MVRSRRRPDEEGRAGGSLPAGRLPPSPPPAPSHGGSVPGSAAGAAREGEHKPPLNAGAAAATWGAAGGSRRAGIWSCEEKWRVLRFLLLKIGAKPKARQTLPFSLAPSQRAPGKPQPRRALPPWLGSVGKINVHFLLREWGPVGP